MLTKKGAATRLRIIDAAAAEIREHGVNATKLDDVCRRSGTGKSQLFHYFPDGKEELLLAVARREAGRVLEDQQPHLGALTTWAAWRSWRDAVVERYRRQGVHCPLGVLITELGRHTPAAQEVTGQLLAQWEAQVRTGIETMRESGNVRADIDPGATAMAIIAAIQGGVTILMSTGSARYLETALDLCLDHLRSTGAAP
ncbi:TetR/AcrR family transcriptional regulator [Amycolatopsis sp. NPDC059027]|uniref:TetR/AcrR family transcriptional regulator n=1 Tax=unclassified Amycolatopsis TaxID=2618356 RepID=UPI00366E85EC